MNIDVKEFEALKKELESTYNDITSMEATAKVVASNVKEKLMKHGVKTPQELKKLRDDLSEHVSEEFRKAKEYLKEVQPKIAEVKNDLIS